MRAGLMFWIGLMTVVAGACGGDDSGTPPGGCECRIMDGASVVVVQCGDPACVSGAGVTCVSTGMIIPYPAACSGGMDAGPSSCTPGAPQECSCPDGRVGTQSCNSDGMTFSACVCSDEMCGPSNCAGCCTALGGCQSGASSGACGSGGVACISCVSGETCSVGRCICLPDCAGRVCGADGCGGTCGAGCAAGRVCNATGTACELPACSSCSECGSEEVCLFGRCGSPWGRDYRITLLSGRFPDRTPGGLCWDTPGCGFPDPTARVRTNDSPLTDALACADDTLTPMWGRFTDRTLNRSDSLDFALIDEDPGGALGCDGFTNDYICGFRWMGPGHPDWSPAGDLRTLICNGGEMGVDISFCGAGYSFSLRVDPL